MFNLHFDVCVFCFAVKDLDADKMRVVAAFLPFVTNTTYLDLRREKHTSTQQTSHLFSYIFVCGCVNDL